MPVTAEALRTGRAFCSSQETCALLISITSLRLSTRLRSVHFRSSLLHSPDPVLAEPFNPNVQYLTFAGQAP
jgi:hypothetical protein